MELQQIRYFLAVHKHGSFSRASAECEVTQPALTIAVKKLEGEKAAIGVQANGMPSLVIDDPVQLGERFLENGVRFTKTELQEIVYQLADGDLRRRLETLLSGDGWEINGPAVRSALANNAVVSGARLVKGHHVRLR